MYKLENQVCTLEQAKILKDEFGLELETYFAWTLPKELSPIIVKRETTLIVHPTPNLIPAPSCAELGVLLPDVYELDSEWEDESLAFRLRSSKMKQDFNVYYFNPYPRAITHSNATNRHEAHAKADLLIHLLKEKIINPGDLKL